MSQYTITHLALFFAKQNEQNEQVYCLTFCPLGKFSFTTLSFRDIPERSCSAVAVYFQMDTTYYTEAPKQAQDFSSVNQL